MMRWWPLTLMFIDGMAFAVFLVGILIAAALVDAVIRSFSRMEPLPTHR